MSERQSVFPVVIAGFTAFLGLYATQPLLPTLASAFGASALAVSLTVTAPTVAFALASPFAGSLADALGRKRVIVATAAAMAATTALAATSGALSTLVFWRFMQGLFTPGVVAVTIAYIHEEYPRERAGRATAAYVSGTVVGGFTGRALVGVMASHWGWAAGFAVLSVVCAAAALILALRLPMERAVRVRSRTRSLPRMMIAHVTNPGLAASYAVGFCVLFVQVAMFTYVTFRLAAAPYLLSSAALGWIFAVYLFGAVATPPSGRWIDAYGHRAALAAAIGIGVTGSILTLMPPLGLIVVGLALTATGVFIAQATASSYVGATAERDRGLAVGLYGSFYYTGGAAGSILPALLWTHGGWPACVALVAAVQLATVGLAWSFWSTRGWVRASADEVT